jgi:hypothetical protein
MYFGKTTKNPEKYLGSGSYWVRHIKKHGKQYVINLWYCLFYNELECREFALQFSKQHNIVESKEWANQIPEQVEDTNNTAGFSPAIDNKNNNLGLISTDDPRWKLEEIHHPRKNKTPWNKGLTKNNDSRLGGGRKLGCIPWNKGIPHSDETKKNMSKPKTKTEKYKHPKPIKVTRIFDKKPMSLNVFTRWVNSI